MRDVNIISLFSGRFHTFDPYLHGLKGLDYDKAKMKIVWYTNATNPSFKRMLHNEAVELARLGYNIKLFEDTSLTPSQNAFMENGPRPMEHAIKIAALYNSALGCIRRNRLGRVFFLEDDVGVPSHALKRLMNDLDEDKEACYVSGVQFDRHSKSQMFSWDYELSPEGINGASKAKYKVRAPAITWGVVPIGLSHLGVTLIDFNRLPSKIKWPIFGPHVTAKGAEQFVGCDIKLCFDIWRFGGKCLLDNDVRVFHYDSQAKPH